ncbi:MAG: B3/4 domain-containing protein [Thermoplasmatota archaeon]
MEILLDGSVSRLGVSVSTSVLDDVLVKGSRKEAFRALERDLKVQMRERFGTLDDVKDDQTVRALRNFYWKIGIDPTKTRPSSEAILRRLLKKELPMINNLVDAGNLASAKTIVPVGIYDLDKVVGGAVIRMSREGEEFIGIGDKVVELPADIPVLADDEGVIHLYPHRDSMRTRITEDCKRALLVSCGAPGIKKKLLVATLKEVEYYWRQLRV